MKRLHTAHKVQSYVGFIAEEDGGGWKTGVSRWRPPGELWDTFWDKRGNWVIFRVRVWG